MAEGVATEVWQGEAAERVVDMRVGAVAKRAARRAEVAAMRAAAVRAVVGKAVAAMGVAVKVAAARAAAATEVLREVEETEAATEVAVRVVRVAKVASS